MKYAIYSIRRYYAPAILFLLGILSFPSHAQDEADPWQGFNRAMFAFNDVTDRYLFKPLAKGYVFVTPKFVRKGVNNVFDNVLEVPNVLNDVLQGKGKQAAKDTGRFLVNSTVGLAGLFDVAQHMGMPRSDGEDFGQTLAVWGVGQGPYVVLPFMGPTTLRDGLAMPVNIYSDPRAYIDHVPTRNTVTGLSLLNTRANLLDLERHITGDRYTFIRDAYLQRRQFLIHDGEVEDDFGMGDDFGGAEDFGY
ncbi:MAG: VacJ family lipoprotein [Cellvibrio sp.]